MSGVYIKGMEMPTSCYDCPCNKDDGFGFFTCGVTKSECDFIRLPSDCPLIPVPDHGRGIDADLLCKVLQRNSEDEWNKNVAPFSWSYAYDCVKDTVENMPTIIPADHIGEANEMVADKEGEG